MDGPPIGQVRACMRMKREVLSPAIVVVMGIALGITVTGVSSRYADSAAVRMESSTSTTSTLLDRSSVTTSPIATIAPVTIVTAKSAAVRIPGP